MSENDYILTIIAKQLKGLASGSELEQLREWLQESIAHREYYDELLEVWRNTEVVFNHQTVDTAAAWQKVEGQLESVKTAPLAQAPAVSFFTKQIAAAAVLLLIAGIGIIWWFNHERWENITATASNQLLILPDKSTVHLRKGGKLSYPHEFSGKLRTVKLNGEAYFEVQHRPEQAFRILTAHSTIQVLGTSFLVHNRAYTDEVVVVSGKVQVQDAENKQQIIVPAGQRVVLQKHQFVKQPVTDSNFIAWRTGHLDFDNTPLPKVLEDISHYYGTQVELDAAIPANAAALRVTVRFDQQPLEQAMEEIRLITGLALKKEDDKMILYQK